MAYQDRQEQLNKTLQTYIESAYRDFNVIIVDDCSKEDIVLPELPFTVDIVKIIKRDWYNSGVVYNIGFNKALEYKPDIVIITNPECYHVGDVISHSLTVTDENYISFGCFKLNKGTNGNIQELIEQNNYIIRYDDNGTWNQPCAWGNHPTIDPVGFHYASAITTKNLIKINGFEERFAHGVSFEDDYLVRQIKALGLRIDITEYPFVVHQYHDSWQTIDQVPELWKLNELILYDLIGIKEDKEIDYKAQHLITPDLWITYQAINSGI